MCTTEKDVKSADRLTNGGDSPRLWDNTYMYILMYLHTYVQYRHAATKWPIDRLQSTAVCNSSAVLQTVWVIKGVPVNRAAVGNALHWTHW